MANESVLFKRGDSDTITSTPVIDGQILFDTSGNGKMYLDNGTDRLAMGGAITVDASLSKTSTNAIQNKAVTGNILNSLTEVDAATQQNTIAGALALKEANSALKETNSNLGGCSFEQEGNDFYITGADSVRKKLGNDDVRMFTLSFPNTDGTCTLDNLDLTGDPNFIAVSTANNVWVDAVYNAIAPYGQTGLVSDKVKMCAYATSQKIEYRDKSDVFPVCTKDVVTINYSFFRSGVGNKTTRVVIAHF